MPRQKSVLTGVSGVDTLPPGALLVDNADLDPAWIETTLIPVLTDPERIAAMSAHASAAGAP